MDANDVQEHNSTDSSNQTILYKSEKDNSISEQQENDRNVNDNDDDQEGLDHSSSSQVSTTSSSLLLPPPPIYEINQKVECRYGVVVNSNDNNNDENHDNTDSSENQWYDAIIRKMKLQPISSSTSTSSTTAGDNNQNVPQSLEWSYLVHYQGWNSRYDQWCTGESIRIKPEINTNATTTTTTGNNSDMETSLPTISNSTTPQRIKNNKRSPSRSPRHKSMSTSSQSSEINVNRKRSRNNPINTTTTTTKSDNSNISVPIVCTYSDYCKLPITLQIIVIEEHERMTNCCKYHHNQSPSKQQEKGNDIHNQSLVYLHPLPALIPIRKVLNSFIKKKIKEIHKQQLLTNHTDHQPVTTTTTTTTTNERNNNDLHTPTKKMSLPSTTSDSSHQNRETIDPETKTSVSNSSSNNKTTQLSSLPIITEDIMRQFGKSLQELFQHALFKCLLYPIEREQYRNIVLPILQQQQDETKDDNEISNTTGNDNVDTNASTDTPTSSKKIKKKLELIDIYGCEYLLRLYIRLPMLLQGTMLYTTTTTNMNGSTDTAVLPSTTPLSSPYILGPLLSDLLIVLQKHRQTLFFTKS